VGAVVIQALLGTSVGFTGGGIDPVLAAIGDGMYPVASGSCSGTCGAETAVGSGGSAALSGSALPGSPGTAGVMEAGVGGVAANGCQRGSEMSGEAGVGGSDGGVAGVWPAGPVGRSGSVTIGQSSHDER
jgi:hypothetical protein